MNQTNPIIAYTSGLKASATSSHKDFDFLEGKWKVHNRKLKARLENCNEWLEFESEIHMRRTLLGYSNIENYYATFDGKPFEGMAVRLFNSDTRLWSVYWMDSSASLQMDTNPVTGSFENGMGKLYSTGIYQGKNIIVLYQWDAVNPHSPKWSQAFSEDNGQTWEWNWEMFLTRIE